MNRPDIDTLIKVHVPNFFWEEGETSGQHFERVMFEVLRFKAETEANEPLWKPKEWRKERVKFHIQDTRKTKLDVEEGTDCLVDGLHVDWTCDYFGKKTKGIIHHFSEYTLRLSEDGEDFFVYYGVRYSNLYRGGKNFKVPVWVIGIDGDHHLDDKISVITNHLDKVMWYGRDPYLEVLYKDGEDAGNGTE